MGTPDPSQRLRISSNCYAKKIVLYPQKPWTPVRKRMPVVAEHPTPGPNAMPLPSYIGYQVMNSAIIHRPAWSLHQRVERKLSHYPAGPASYYTRDLAAKGGRASAPQYTMRIKPMIRPLQELPGPATYEAQAKFILPRAPSFTCRVKPINAEAFKTPAPNEYTLPTILGHHHNPPSHVMGHRLSRRPPVVTPGPGAYDHEHLNKRLPHAPEFSVREKLTAMEKDDVPGPGSYCPERVILNRPMAPKQTMGIKHSPFSGVWHPRIIGPRHC